MSTGAQCTIYTDGHRWAYKLQKWPYGEWSEYETYGPFNSEKHAEGHLFSNHANPGGWGVADVTPDMMNEVLREVQRT